MGVIFFSRVKGVKLFIVYWIGVNFKINNAAIITVSLINVNVVLTPTH